MGFRYEEINNRNEHWGGGALTLYIFAISCDCFDLKSSDYSLRKILGTGTVFLLRLLLAVKLVVYHLVKIKCRMKVTQSKAHIKTGTHCDHLKMLQK